MSKQPKQPSPPKTPTPSELKVGAQLRATITGLSARGEGSVAVGERTLLVPGLIPGDTARVLVEALARFHPRAHGRALERLEPSPDRREPPCPRHLARANAARSEGEPRAECSGCPLMIAAVPAQRAAKLARMRSELGLPVEAFEGGAELGYRWSSKRSVAGRSGALVLGSPVGGPSARRKPKTPSKGLWLADMRGCLVDHPRIVAAFETTRLLANALAIEAWRDDDEGGSGDLRHLWAKTDGERVLLTLITGARDSRAARELGPALLEQGAVAGVAWSVQGERSNALRGSSAQTLGGLDELAFEVLSVPLRVGALGFLQPNPEVAAKAYVELVRGETDLPEHPDPNEGLALDLYAGAGVTTGLLRRRFAEVRACESHPESAAALGVPAQTAEQFLAAQLEGNGAPPALVVANPPRAGLGEAVCAQLLSLDAPRLHIMSCNPDTLAADLDRLAPGYVLDSLRAYDTLPQTPHVELVARLRRRAPEPTP